jgi:predicted PurR-regulated permease PerM
MDYNQENQLPDWQEKKLPSSLNILTILTFIGSGLTLLGAFAYPSICKMMGTLEDTLESLPNQQDAEKQITMLNKLCSNLPMLMGSLIIGSLLCIAGAYMMRKLNKTGYIVYLAGTIIPILLLMLIVGVNYYTNDPKQMVGLVFSFIFPILYYTQLKHMKN